MKSKPYKHGGKLFRYDFDECMVEYIYKVTPAMLQDNEEWLKEFGEPLWNIDADGYCIAECVGLRTENWKNKESRDGYLDQWIDEMAEEAAYEMDFFMKHEYPLYAKGV